MNKPTYDPHTDYSQYFDILRATVSELNEIAKQTEAYQNAGYSFDEAKNRAFWFLGTF